MGKKDIKIEAPHIAVGERHGISTAASIQLNVNSLVMQHEFVCQYVKENYKSSDIRLDLKIKDNQTILKYYGTATNLNGETVDFDKEVKCDFVLDANIVD